MIIQLGNYNAKQHKRNNKDVCAMKIICSGIRPPTWASEMVRGDLPPGKNVFGFLFFTEHVLLNANAFVFVCYVTHLHTRWDVYLNTIVGLMHGRNLVGNTGDVTPHFFRRGRHNMPCPFTFASLDFVFEEVSNIKVMFVTFCVKSISS